MDQNKLRVLRAIGYTIRPSCTLCKHSNLSPDGWGTCGRHSFAHEKHGRTMPLSINATGSCAEGFEPMSGTAIYLGTFAEFVDGRG